MSDDIFEGFPTILTYEGVDVRELSQDKLIEILKELHSDNDKLREENRRRSVAHINDLAMMARARAEGAGAPSCDRTPELFRDAPPAPSFIQRMVRQLDPIFTLKDGIATRAQFGLRVGGPKVDRFAVPLEDPQVGPVGGENCCHPDRLRLTEGIERYPLLYGSSQVEICSGCQRWRMIRDGFNEWRPGPYAVALAQAIEDQADR